MATVAFGPFTLDAARGALLRDGAPVPLGQRAIAVLAALAETPGRTVPKQELLALAWPGTIVEEGNLTVQIAALRKALGADPWILTVPRVGYRLAASVPAAQEPAAAIPTLAVLPFADLGRGGHGWFADGVVEDITAALGRFRSFAVLPRSAAFASEGWRADSREVARALGVRYLLEGTVRRSGERLRITAQLLEGASGAQLWADTFDGELAEVFDFQDRITDAVATIVEPRIQAAEIERSRRERPGSVATYDIYLRALAGILSETEAGNAEAYELILEGLDHEPRNPHLLTLAAWALEHRATVGWPEFGPDDRQRCGMFARAALERSGGDALILSRCGMSLLQGAREYDWGMAVLDSAVATNPNDVMALVQAAVGRLHCGDLDEALVLVRRAERLQAGDLGAHFAFCLMAHVALIRGHYAEAFDFASQAFARNPNFDPTLWMLVASLAHLGRMEDARRYLGKLVELAPGITIARIREGQPAKDPSRIAAVLAGLRLAGLPEG